MTIGEIFFIILLIAFVLETTYIFVLRSNRKPKEEVPVDDEALQDMRELFDSAYPEFMDVDDDNPLHYVLAADVTDNEGEQLAELTAIGDFLLEVIQEVYPHLSELTRDSKLPPCVLRHDDALIVAFLEKVARDGCEDDCYWYVHPLDTNQYIITESDGYEVINSSSSLIVISK